MLQVGDNCPHFNTVDEADNVVQLSDFQGQYCVVFFYPKDATPGCTIEAKDFSEQYAAVAAAGIAVLGVSKDTQSSHVKFKTKHALQMPLLVDTDKTMCEGFGVLTEKSMFGKKYMGIVRSTFLIDPNGQIAHVWSPVKISGHVNDVLATTQALLQS